MSRGFVVCVASLALFAGSVLLYAPSIEFGFVGYDDTKILLENPNLYAQGTVWDSLREIFVGYFPREEPLLVRDLSWLFDARVFGFVNPVGYHLGNVLLNAADVVMLFLFLLHATRRPRFAALTATLFSTLAVHVEPVCWIMGRKDVLSAFFVLAALLAQSAQLRQSNPGRRLLLGTLVFFLYPVAVLAKFSAIFLILILAAHRVLAPYLDGSRPPSEAFPVRRWPRLLVGLLPHAMVGAGLYVWYRQSLAAFRIIGTHSPGPLSLAHLKHLAVLVPLSLKDSLVRIFLASEHSISYLRPSVSLRAGAGELALAFAVVAGLLALAVLLLRYRKDLALFPVAFFCFMAPYFNFEYVGIWAADRYAYLASFCVLALLAALVLAGLRSPRALLRRLAFAGLGLLGLLGGYEIAAGRVHQYAFRGRESLWAYEKRLPHPSLLAFESYAKTMLLKAQNAEADPALRRRLLEAAVDTAREGVAYYQSIDWQPAPGYTILQPIQLASFLGILGTAAELAGAPLEQQLELHMAAFRISSGNPQKEALARTLLALAQRDPRDVEKARASLRLFRDHVRFASRDRLMIPGLRAQLRAYAAAFPELAADVGAIERESLR